MWNRWEDDHMEYEDSHLVPVEGGYRNTLTGEFITEDGYVYDSEGELTFDPNEPIDPLIDEEDYDTFDD